MRFGRGDFLFSFPAAPVDWAVIFSLVFKACLPACKRLFAPLCFWQWSGFSSACAFYGAQFALNLRALSLSAVPNALSRPPRRAAPMLGPAARRLRRQHAAVLQNCKFARMIQNMVFSRLFSPYFQGALLDVVLDRLSSPFVCVGEWRQCSALSARRPRRRRAAVFKRRGRVSSYKKLELPSFCLFLLFQEALLDVVLDRSSPLAASSVGGLGAASEAAPVRPYPKTSSSEDQAGPASKHRRGKPFVLSASLGRPLRRRRPLPFLVPVGSLVSSPRQDHSFFGRRGPFCGTVFGGVSLRGRVWRRR